MTLVNCMFSMLMLTHQIKVFAGLAEEEALHTILFGLVNNVVEGSVPTPGKKKKQTAFSSGLNHTRGL